MQIWGGAGFPFIANVSKELRLWVESKSRPSEEVEAEAGNAYILHAQCHLAAAAAGGLMYFKNTSSTKEVVITRIYIDSGALTPTNVIVYQVKEPATVTSGTDISTSLVIGKCQKHYGKGSGQTLEGTLVQSDGSADLTYSGGQVYHAFPVPSMSSQVRDMKGTNVITPQTTILWGWASVGSATNAEIIALSVNCFVRDVS